MELLPTIFAVVLIVITIVLTVVGVQLIFVLQELRKTIHKINVTIAGAEAKMTALMGPLHNLGGMASGVRTGMRVFETFVGWLNRDKSSKK